MANLMEKRKDILLRVFREEELMSMMKGNEIAYKDAEGQKMVYMSEDTYEKRYKNQCK